MAAPRRTEELALDRSADFVTRGYALCLERRFTDAVAVYKEGLALAPDDEELQKGLRTARLAVLDDLADVDDTDDGDSGNARGAWFATPQTSEGDGVASLSDGCRTAVTALWTRSQPPVTASERALVFEEKVDRLLGHLDVAKLSRLATLYVMTELLQLKRVTLGLALLVLGVLGQALVHRHKFMVASILFLCVYQSKVRLIAWRHVNTWAHASTDKLGAFMWAPRLACVVPIAMKVFGLLRFMVFLQRDWTLSLFVALVAGALVVASVQASAGEQLKLWGQGKRLKFAAYATAIAYWGVWRGEGGDILRLLPGALIDAGGIVLGSLTSAELQSAVRRAWEKLYAEVADDIQQDVEFDAWFLLGLGRWIVDYWQQPSDFSLEMLTKMLAEGFSSLEAAAVHVFRPELRHLKRQMAHLSESGEMAVLVAYLKKSLDEIPPSKSVGLIGACPRELGGLLRLLCCVHWIGFSKAGECPSRTRPNPLPDAVVVNLALQVCLQGAVRRSWCSRSSLRSTAHCRCRSCRSSRRS